MPEFFTKDFAQFFTDLEKNNKREWFEQNKERYEKSVKSPFYHFIDTLINEVSKKQSDLLIDPKNAIFRIYRDVRFGKDKTPYKTNCSALIAPGGRKAMGATGFYLEFSAAGIGFYSGIYQPDTKTLKSIREHIIDHEREFYKLVKDKKFISSFGAVQGEKSKIIPKEMKDAASKQPYIYNKQFLMIKKWDQAMLLDKNLIKTIQTCFENSRDFSLFLNQASQY